MLTYAQQLKSPQWQKRRLERLQTSDFTCDLCGDAKTELHVHHPQYFKGRKAWEYSDDELEVLCQPCHSRHHELESAIKDARAAHPLGHRFLDGLLVGFLDSGLDLSASDEALSDVCLDGRIAGGIAYLYFHARREAKDEVLAVFKRYGALDLDGGKDA